MINIRKASSFTFLAVVFLFMYIPIILMFIYSFNESKLATIWSGFSYKWYIEVIQDDDIISAVLYSLKIAFFTACGATVAGTWIGFILARDKFRGQSFFTAMVNAPVVLPEVIIGLALLLLFVSINQTTGLLARGSLTIWIGHVLLSVAYVAVIVQSRCKDLDSSLEEAAQDLGAKPLKIFFVITLPLISTSLVSGWLLAFTFSMDNLVVTSFLSGPDDSTLPVLIFSRARLGLSPEINALATILLVTVSTAAVVANLFLLKRERDMAKL